MDFSFITGNNTENYNTNQHFYNFLLVLGTFLATKNFYIPLILFYLLLDTNHHQELFFTFLLSCFTFSFTKFSPQIFIFHLVLASYFIKKPDSIQKSIIHNILLFFLLIISPITPLLYDIVLCLLVYNGILLKDQLIEIYNEKIGVCVLPKIDEEYVSNIYNKILTKLNTCIDTSEEGLSKLRSLINKQENTEVVNTEETQSTNIENVSSTLPPSPPADEDILHTV
jgi:hypothetical protein